MFKNIVLGVKSAISLQCNQVLCLTTPVQYQCTVNESILLRWRIIDENMTTLDTETYSDGDSLVSFSPITNAPDFSHALSIDVYFMQF